ncbi:MAG: redoxin domain-containing protein [Acidimicrobiia bacterium]|nr:redoxin domain-containing protein [Acidimicrobiia bacterium]
MRYLLLVLTLTAGLCQQTADKIKQGHSRHGEAFDSGPRARPWEMKGTGQVSFPITAKNPEVQKWFNQGIVLLHSFWEYEAERAFRWCLKLEPDNAMAWWGLARATSGERSEEFVREAAKRKASVSERERLYIQALEALHQRNPLRDRGDDYREREGEYRKVLESISVKYPDDMEARAMLALSGLGENRYGTERIVREILAAQPDHPGAHHYRIHNWNYHEPEQALESCRRYGEIAPGVGHALHMPGHVYATVGMWHEAAISMNSATRVEIKYMQDRLAFPFNNWNYGHNRNYLSYIQEQLGMADAAILGARQLIDAPLDPKFNADAGYSSHSQGIRAMTRALIKFERWDKLLDSRTIPWRDTFSDKMHRAYAEARAHFGMGKADKAVKPVKAHADLKKDLEKNKGLEKLYEIQAAELAARTALAEGDSLRGLALLGDAAAKQFQQQKSDNDPPSFPQVLYIELGKEYLKAGAPALAVKSYEKALELTRNDCFARAGLVEAWAASGDKEKAADAMAQLLHVTSDADAGLPFLERAKATGIKARPRDVSPMPQRSYQQVALGKFGPAVWEPYGAPKLEAVDHEGKPVALEEYRGRNVILVFYLGKECLHCLSQLRDIDKRKSDWERLQTVVLAVSSNKPADNAESLKSIAAPVARILSDQEFENARRFHSYDDFEEMEIHSTILIDKKGRVHWARSGGEPFTDMGFLVKQLERMNAAVE